MCRFMAASGPGMILAERETVEAVVERWKSREAMMLDALSEEYGTDQVMALGYMLVPNGAAKQR